MIVNIIDVSGFIYRAFYGIPHLMHNGIEVGALYGFCSAMRNITAQFPNSMFIAALDSGKLTFRNEIYSEYKSNRKAMPAELLKQIPFIKKACEKFGFFLSEAPGFEADDIIASYVEVLKDRDCHINIISSDKDLTQLLCVDNVKIFDPMKQKHITKKEVFEKFGVPPNKVLDVLALMGDSSDNIPGVPGIGLKTAASLINQFGSLDNLIKNINTLPDSKKYITLKNEIDKAILSKELAALKNNIPVKFEYLITKSDNINEFFQEFGFKSLMNRNV